MAATVRANEKPALDPAHNGTYRAVSGHSNRLCEALDNAGYVRLDGGLPAFSGRGSWVRVYPADSRPLMARRSLTALSSTPARTR